MKNKLKLILVGIISLVLVTGCGMKTNIHMDIKANNDVNVSMTMAMDDELIDTMIGYGDDNKTSATITDKDRWAYLEESMNDSDDMEGYTKVKYDKDGYKGYTYTSKTFKLDDLTTTKSDTKYDFFGNEKIDNAKLFVKSGNVYKSNFSADMKNDESLGSSSSYSSQMSLFEVTFSVTLPNKPSKNNATEVSKDGKTLTWDLTKTTDIQFEFSTAPNYMLYAGIAVLVVVVIAVIAIIAKSVGKKKDKPEEPKEEKPSGEEKPVAQPEGEQSKEEAPAEETPAEEAKEEPAPAEEPKEETSLEEMYNGEAPVEEKPVEEAPAEETPAEPAPEEEAPVEENKE